MANTNPIASLAQIRARLQMKAGFTADDAWLSQALLEVSRDVEGWAKWSLRRDTATEIHGEERSYSILGLDKVHPIESVTSVKEAADRDFASADALIEDEDFVVYEDRNQLARMGGVWVWGRKVIEVVYVGGYVTPDEMPEAGQQVMPADLVGFVLDEAELRYRQRGKAGMTSVSTEAGNATFSPSEFDKRAMARIARHRKVTLL